MPKIKVGDRFVNNSGDEAVVVEYQNCNNIIVVFTGYNTRMSFTGSNLEAGKFRNREAPDKFGTTLGSPYSASEHRTAHQRWRSMVERCHEKHAGYENVSVCEEWLCFENYAKWYYSQKAANMRGFDVDKDISGANIYSPETCYLIPRQLNTIFSSMPTRSLQRGVYFVKENKFRQYSSVVPTAGGKKRASFTTPELARDWYLRELRVYIEFLLEKYKEFLSEDCIEKVRSYDLTKL